MSKIYYLIFIHKYETMSKSLIKSRYQKAAQGIILRKIKMARNKKTFPTSDFCDVFTWWKKAHAILYKFPWEWDSETKEIVEVSNPVRLLPWYLNIFGFQLGLGGFSSAYLICRRIFHPREPEFMETIHFTHIVIFSGLLLAVLFQSLLGLAIHFHANDIVSAFNELVGHNASIKYRK